MKKEAYLAMGASEDVAEALSQSDEDFVVRAERLHAEIRARMVEKLEQELGIQQQPKKD